jgi:hypothetical protein
MPAVLVDSPPRMDTGEFQESPSQTPYAGRPVPEELFPRSRTIAFDDDEDPSDRTRGMATGREGAYFPRTATHRSHGYSGDPLPFSNTTSTLPRTYSLRPVTSRKQDTRMSGFGGFPTPFEIARTLVDKFAPNASRTLTKTLTMPRTATIGPTSTMGRRDTGFTGEDTMVSEAPYITFAATVGRNSRFTGLTEEQMDELGGVEYRALRVLLYIVVGVSNVTAPGALANRSMSLSSRLQVSSSSRPTLPQAGDTTMCLRSSLDWLPFLGSPSIKSSRPSPIRV